MGLIKAVPDENQALCPYLIVKSAAEAIRFYARAFEARELFRLKGPSGKLAHAELAIGNSRFMLADEHPDFGALSPFTVGGSPVSIHLYVPDVDKTIERAAECGATVLRTAKDEFFGDRVGLVLDPFGHRWHIASRRENVTPEEMQRRFEQAYA